MVDLRATVGSPPRARNLEVVGQEHDQEHDQDDGQAADQPPEAPTGRPARRLPLSTVVVATLLSVVIAALVAGLLLGVGEAGGPDEPATLDNATPTVPALGGGGADTVGRPAPIAPYDLFDGGQASVAGYRGTPLVVNFFASWCVPCVREMPAFEEVHQDLGDQVAFLGIDVQDSVRLGRQLVERTGVTYDTGRDPDASMLASYGGVAMPTTVLVDADGTIVHLMSGGSTASELRDAIDEHLLAPGSEP